MTTNELSNLTITTDEQFESLLSELLDTAMDNGLDVTGVWTCDNHRARHDWEVEVVELLADDSEAD